MPRRRKNPATKLPKKKRLHIEMKAGSEVGKGEDGNSSGAIEDDCPICCESFNFKTTLPECGHCFCFLCIKGVAIRGGVCPLCRTVIPLDIFDKPEVEEVKDEPGCSTQPEGTEPATSAAETVEPDDKPLVQWFYAARSGGWWRFEPRQEGDIEVAFSEGKTDLELLIAGYPYRIDFTDMRQYRKDLPRSPRWERQIKRVSGKEDIAKMSSPIRGVAGLLTSRKK